MDFNEKKNLNCNADVENYKMLYEDNLKKNIELNNIVLQNSNLENDKFKILSTF